jgi:hypothetical protein
MVSMLTTAGVAMAALPKRGAHFAGNSSLSPINGFHAPVTFVVAQNGKSLLNFRYSSFGCFGAGGFQPGIDYYTKPFAVIKVGTVKVAASGHFNATGAVSVFSLQGQTTRTTTRVSGSFTSAKVAKGTISFSQLDSGHFSSSCGPGSISFIAKAH